MISSLIPRKAVIKKIVLLKKLLVFQGKSSGKETDEFMCRLYPGNHAQDHDLWGKGSKLNWAEEEVRPLCSHKMSSVGL